MGLTNINLDLVKTKFSFRTIHNRNSILLILFYIILYSESKIYNCSQSNITFRFSRELETYSGEKAAGIVWDGKVFTSNLPPLPKVINMEIKRKGGRDWFVLSARP